MTDVQFIQRLHLELTNPQHWPEILAATTSQTDPALAANELLVHPRRQPALGPVVLRVTVECLVPPASGPALS